MIVYGIIKWFKDVFEEDRIGEPQEIKQGMRQSPLYKKTIKEKPWLKYDLDGLLSPSCVGFHTKGEKIGSHTYLDFHRYGKDLITIEDVLQKAEEIFKNEEGDYIRRQYEEIDNYIEEYKSITPFYTLQNLYDEVIKCSDPKLPDHISIRAQNWYLERNQIDIRLKLQKLEKIGALEKYEKMERGKLMDKLDKSYKEWDNKDKK